VRILRLCLFSYVDWLSKYLYYIIDTLIPNYLRDLGTDFLLFTVLNY